MAIGKYLLLIVISMNTTLLAMEDVHLIEDHKKLKLFVKNRKLSISYQLIRARGGPLLNDLIDNPPKISKRDKYFFSKRQKLDCSIEEFNLAYLFITQNVLPQGYFVEKALSAAHYFSLPEMEKYIAGHPPLFSGHYEIATGHKCPHCDYDDHFQGCLEAAKHLEDFHNAIISTSYRWKDCLYWQMRYRIPNQSTF